MKNFRNPLGVAVVLVLALVLGACNNSSKSKKTDTPKEVGVITVDASDNDNYAYFNLDTMEVVDVTNPKTSLDWHIGFKRTSIILNGGDAGEGVTEGALAKAQNSFYSEGEPILSKFFEATPDSEKAVFDSVKNSAGLTFQADTNVGAIGSSWYNGSLTWKVSEQAWTSSSLSPSHAAGNGASKDSANGFVFLAASIAFNPDTLEITASFNGWIQLGNTNQGGYKIRFVNPVFTIAADGSGSLVADVEYCTGTAACAEPWIEVADVTLGEFDAGSEAVSYENGYVNINVTPDFILQGDEANPDRRQFHPSLVGNFIDDPIFSSGALAASLTAHFRQTGDQPLKAPAPITVSFPSNNTVAHDGDKYWIVRSGTNDSFAKFRVIDMIQGGVNELDEITVELQIQNKGESSFALAITENFNIANEGAPICYDIDKAEVANCNGKTWDLRFGTGLDIYLNSGIYGGRSGAAFGPLTADDLAEFTDGNTVPHWVSDGVQGIFDEKTWYTYDISDHKLWSNYRVYVVDTGEKEIKMQILSYYSTEGVSGHYAIRVGEL